MPVIIGTIASSFRLPVVGELVSSHRYWRLTFLDGDNFTYCSLAEVEMRAVADGPSIATGGTAFGTNDRGGSWVKANAFDGNANSFFSTTEDYPVYLGYDFGTNVEVVEIMIKARPTFNDHTPTVFRLEASDDMENWAFMGIGSIESDWTAAQELVCTVAPPDFDTTHQRVGYSLGTTSNILNGNLSKAYAANTLTHIVGRTGNSGVDWEGRVFRATSKGMIKSQVATFSHTNTSSGEFIDMALSSPVAVKKGEHIVTLFRRSDDPSQGSRLNFMRDGNTPAIYENIGDGWNVTSDNWPSAGDVSDSDTNESSSDGHLINFIGTYEREPTKRDYLGKTVVLVIMGQSNAVGRATDTLSSDTTTTANVLTCNSSHALIDAVEPLPTTNSNENSGQMGYGYGVAREFLTRHSPARVIVINLAVGGAGFLNGDWNPSNGPVYDSAKARWEACWSTITSTYPGAEIGSIIWTQGEDEVQDYTTLFDGTDDDHRYAAMVMGLFETVRRSWTGFDQDVPIVVTPIPGSSNYTNQPAANSNIQTGIGTIAQSMKYAALVDMSGVTETYKDAGHWDGDTYRQMFVPIVDAIDATLFNNWTYEKTSDWTQVSGVKIGLDARGLAEGATITNVSSEFPEFDNKRVFVDTNSRMNFDGQAELRWRDNGKPRLGTNDFSIRLSFESTSSVEQGLIADYQTTGNKRSWVLRRSSTSTLQFYVSNNGTSADLALEHSISSNTTYKVEVKRTGTLLELYVDDVVVDTHTLASGYDFFDTGDDSPLLIGDHINGRELVGYLDYVFLELL
ncbi:hypothetical protein HYO99_gp40 [Roseobacter phage RD-1410W1-01]|uniref:Sialate O-acetylesterase domain-containing protein n=1 Tax=Roseobacter phage RD-1410W1-01 TaxID=1815984 RepID=A0A191VYI9_9CAUD|nr:hypothetical protein HYO99_gp40 [Roseobacter phage RD-1410W1-01]ANJ20774.1 hypothetical protein RDp01_gp40 [Roseobacter phage RD-1410W1-01]